MNNSASLRAILISCSICTALGSIGCGSGVRVGSISGATVTVATTGAKGIVKGGQQPAAGVKLQLYQAGTTGYGSAATPSDQQYCQTRPATSPSQTTPAPLGLRSIWWEQADSQSQPPRPRLR